MEALDRLLEFSDEFSALSVDTILISLLTAFLLGQIVAWVYVWTHRGVSYAGSLARALVALALIVTLVMLVVGSNLARAFGLFGALALIRFRTPVKDAGDTVFLFLAVAVGIATGTGNLTAAVCGTVVICAAISYLARSGFGSRLDHDGLLRLRLPAGSGQQPAIRGILDRYCDGFRLLHLRETEEDGSMELAFQIRMIDSRHCPGMVAEIEGRPGVSNLSLLMQDAEVTP